jgi:hypothetical protein
MQPAHVAPAVPDADRKSRADHGRHTNGRSADGADVDRDCIVDDAMHTGLTSHRCRSFRRASRLSICGAPDACQLALVCQDIEDRLD